MSDKIAFFPFSLLYRIITLKQCIQNNLAIKIAKKRSMLSGKNVGGWYQIKYCTHTLLFNPIQSSTICLNVLVFFRKINNLNIKILSPPMYFLIF